MKNYLDIETEIYCCQFFSFVAHGYKFFNFFIFILFNFSATGKAFFIKRFYLQFSALLQLFFMTGMSEIIN